MNKNLLNHSFYIKQPRQKTFTDKLFIFKIDDKGYHVFDEKNPNGYKIFTLQPDYEKYCNTLPLCDGAVKIVKHNTRTVAKMLVKVLNYKEEMKNDYNITL